jgi:hypothetical protein
MIKLSPNERLLVESWVNRYRLVGPGLVWVKPWQKVRARLYIGPNAISIDCQHVRTREEIPVRVIAKVIYQVKPELITEAVLPRVPALNEGGWKSVVEWRSEALLRRLMAKYEWRALKDEAIQEDLEQQLNQALIDRLAAMGVELIAVNLVKIELGQEMQRTITHAEQDAIEADGRARVLKSYLEIFGDNLTQVMPYIREWEMLNLLHKNDNLQPLLMTNTSSNGLPENSTSRPNIQIVHNKQDPKGNSLERRARLTTHTDINITPMAN